MGRRFGEPGSDAKRRSSWVDLSNEEKMFLRVVGLCCSESEVMVAVCSILGS